MSSSLTVQALLDRNTAGLNAHKPIPKVPDIKAMGRAPHILVISCVDPRCIPENFLHLQTGEVLVLRNVGGNAAPFINDIISLDDFVTLSDIVVIQHTDCGATYFKDENVKQNLKERVTGHDKDIDEMMLGAMDGSVEESIKKSLNVLNSSPYLRPELKQSVHGFLYDLKTGNLTAVDV